MKGTYRSTGVEVPRRRGHVLGDVGIDLLAIFVALRGGETSLIPKPANHYASHSHHMQILSMQCVNSKTRKTELDPCLLALKYLYGYLRLVQSVLLVQNGASQRSM